MFRRHRLLPGDLVWVDRPRLAELVAVDPEHRSSSRHARMLEATAGDEAVVARVVIVERDPAAYECRILFAEDGGPTLAVPLKIPDDERRLLRPMTGHEQDALPRAAMHPARILGPTDD